MERIRDRILAAFFLVLIGATAAATRAWEFFDDMISVCIPFKKEMEVKEEAKEESESTEELTLAGISDILLEELPYKNLLIELSGTLMKKTGIRSYYNNVNGINITRNGYNVGRYTQTSTDYEVEQVTEFKKYLDAKGIRLLYVSEPTKYIDDDFYQEEFGGESYVNRNTDLFLSRIGEAGIDYIDLRENIREEGLDPLSLFYRTDHHWTVPASKWAAEIVAGYLNENYGYEIDLDLYRDENFNTVFYQNAWLGEQGRKVTKSYIGLDDYTMMEPLYNTSYTITNKSETLEGDFGLFIKKERYDLETDPYTATSWHYSYSAYQGRHIHNNQASYGKVLVLGDSYETSMLPFLTLGIQDIDYVIPRTLTDRSVREIVEAGDYDTVIMAYVQFMIGAHDKEHSANYKMFVLD